MGINRGVPVLVILGAQIGLELDVVGKPGFVSGGIASQVFAVCGIQEVGGFNGGFLTIDRGISACKRDAAGGQIGVALTILGPVSEVGGLQDELGHGGQLQEKLC